MKPYYLQRNEDSEPVFIGFANSQDEIIKALVDNGTSYLIGKMTDIDIITKDMLEDFEDDYDYETLKNYFERN